MADEARHHHYIPQGYLRGFAQKRGERQWYIHVNDLEAKRSFPTNVRNVCGERDFNRVELEGHPPDRLEKEMSAFETKCVEAIRRIAATGKFDGEDADLTLNLMALFAVRSPEMRENIRDFLARVAQQIMRLSLATKERWEGQMRHMREAGRPVNDNIMYEDMVDFVERGEYEITVKREYHLGTEFQLMPKVLEQLGHRRWTVYTTDGKNGEFITTNRPVTLTYIDPSRVPPWMAHSPGFALKGTEVHFPLTRHAMLVGRWDKGGPPEVAKQSFIRAVNGHMIQHSFGQVFSREKTVLYVDPLCRFWRDDKLIERFTTPPTPEEIEQFRAQYEKPGGHTPSGA